MKGWIIKNAKWKIDDKKRKIIKNAKNTKKINFLLKKSEKMRFFAIFKLFCCVVFYLAVFLFC